MQTALGRCCNIFAIGNSHKEMKKNMSTCKSRKKSLSGEKKSVRRNGNFAPVTAKAAFAYKLYRQIMTAGKHKTRRLVHTHCGPTLAKMNGLWENILVTCELCRGGKINKNNSTTAQHAISFYIILTVKASFANIPLGACSLWSNLYIYFKNFLGRNKSCSMRHYSF
jgi:hypothetical protein